MTTWLIQPTKIEEDKIQSLTNMLTQAGIEHYFVYPLKGQILNADKTEFEFQNDTQYFVCGSYSLTRYVFLKQPSSVFSLEDYPLNKLWDIFNKDNFLNNDAQICHSSHIDWNLHQEYFIRPIEDTKSFNGGIYSQHSLTFDGDVLIASLKEVNKEHRFFVMNGKIITGSLYKINGELYESNIIDEGAIEFANKMIQAFDFPAYVIDIATVNNEYKIIELNCFNAAGFYQSNLYKLINSVEDFYSLKTHKPKIL